MENVNSGAEHKGASIEQSMQQLEQIVSRLEQGDCGLDVSFELFEQAVVISKNLRKQLSEYERKIETVSGVLREGEAAIADFPADE